MDNKKFKKLFQLFVPAADKNNALVLEPGTKDFVIMSDTSGKFKVAVNINDLRDALHEVSVLAALYTEQKEADPIIEGAIIEGDEE